MNVGKQKLLDYTQLVHNIALYVIGNTKTYTCAITSMKPPVYTWCLSFYTNNQP